MESHLRSELRNWLRSTSYTPVQTSNSNHSNPRSTLPPTYFQRKIVCDGAFNRAIHRGGYGVIVYDNEGRVVDGRARSFVCRAPICAEAMAILKAVELAADYEASTIILSDCLALTKALEDQPEQWPWEAAAILASISHILRNHMEISIVHVGRNEVAEADRLAKRARDEALADFHLMF
ncbi:hypothetical protein LINPERHAP2_LOCUS27241 [Linum perenne]